MTSYLMRRLACATTTDVISINRKENNCAYNHVLPLLLEFEDTKSVNQDSHNQSTDDGVYRPGLHPEHPAAVEGCRPVSRGLMLELVTTANVIGRYASCRNANERQKRTGGG